MSDSKTSPRSTRHDASTIRITEMIDLDCPADTVWRLLADYANDPAWRKGVVAMEASPAGLVQVGTTTAEEMRFAGRTWCNGGEVTAVEPGTRFAWRTTRGADAHGARSVEAIDAERCRVRLDLVVRPRGTERLMAPLLARLLRRNLAGDARRMRRLVESDAA